MYRPPNWDKRVEAALKFKWGTDREIFEAGARWYGEALKATGKYIHLHRYLKPPGYKQPIRAPGWVVFIPAQTEEKKGGEV